MSPAQTGFQHPLQLLFELLRLLKMDDMEPQFFGRNQVAVVVVDVNGALGYDFESLDQARINFPEGLPGFFFSRNDAAFKPVKEFIKIKGNRKSFSAPVGECIEPDTGMMFQVAKYFDGLMDRSAQHFLPALIISTDIFFVLGVFGHQLLCRQAEAPASVLLLVPVRRTYVLVKPLPLLFIRKNISIYVIWVPIDKDAAEVKYDRIYFFHVTWKF